MRVLNAGLSVFLATCFAWFEARGQEAAVPPEFDYVGNYEIDRRIKLREGETFPVVTKPFQVRVYTDGISIRLYGGGEQGGYTSYEVYRGEGIIEAPDRTSLETVAGIQAKSMVGGILRHLTLTERRLSIVAHPAISGVIEIYYGFRRGDMDSEQQQQGQWNHELEK